MPGDTTSAGHENPYRASQPLDPRVDGDKPRHEPLTSHGVGNSGLPTSGVAGTGASTTSASQPFNSDSSSSHQPSGYTSSPLTSTSDPTNRSAGNTDSIGTRGLDYATPGTSSTSHQHTGLAPSSSTATGSVDRPTGYTSPFDTEGQDYSTTNTPGTNTGITGTSATGTQPHAESQGMVSKVLSAVGLGGAGAATTSTSGHGSRSGEPHDTSAISTQPGHTSTETGPPQHYRRESIPTTAYPAGPNSPRAVAPPLGGSQVPENYSGSRDTALGGSHIPGSHDTAGHSALGGSHIPGSHDTAGHTAIGGSQPSVAQNIAQNPEAGAPHSTIHDLITTGGPRDNSHIGRDAALGGAAAGAGAYGLHERSHDRSTGTTGNTALPNPEQRLAQPSTGKPSITERVKEALPGVQSEREKQEAARTGTTTTGVPERGHDHPSGIAGTTGTSSLPERSHAYPSGTTGTTNFPDRTRNSPLDAVAGAPSRYDGQDARAPLSSGGTTRNTEQPLRDERHTGRDAALGAGAAAGAGGLAYGAHERKEDREHQKELERQEKQHHKDIEHQQKLAAKEEKHHHHELEKEEKHRQHEAEKAQKHHQHELSKEEKERSAIAATHEKREKARLASEEEDRRRREREATAVGGTALGAGAGAAAIAGHRDEGLGRHSQDNTFGRDHQGLDPNTSTYVRREADGEPVQKHAAYATPQEHHEKEKKPSIFKRIFKSRKNKDTGEDEDYSTDDEEDKARHYAAAGTTGAAGSHVPTHHSDTKGRTVLGSDHGRHSTEHVDPTTGLPYDASKDPEAARRLSREPGADALHGRGTDSAPYGTGAAAGTTAAGVGAGGYTISNTGDRTADDRYHTGQPTATNLGHNTTSTGLGGTTSGLGGTTTGHQTGQHSALGPDGLPQSAHEPFGVIGEHHR